MSHIFISYSRNDQTYARRLVADLQVQGFPVWIDDQIEPADEWWDKIEQAIRDCTAFIVLMTPEANDSKWVKLERTLAKNLAKPTFPLLLSGEIWGFYADTHCVDVRDQRLPAANFYAQLARIVPPHNIPAPPRSHQSPPTKPTGGQSSLSNAAEPLLVSRAFAKSSIRMIHDAEQEFWAKAMALDRTAIDIAQIINKLENNPQFKIRFMLPDPAQEETCQEIDQYVGNYHPISERLKHSLTSLEGLRQRFADQITIRVLPHRPSIGCGIVDPGAENSYARVRIYHFHMDTIAHGGLPFMFLYKSDPSQAEWYEAYLQDFITEWEGATEWIASVDQALPRYDERLHSRSLDRSDIAASVVARGPKFQADGTARPYYGTTCIAMVEQKSALFKTLCDLQQTLKAELKTLELEKLFAFLPPESLHMTICDIEAAPQPITTSQKEARVKQARAAFAHRPAGPITAQVRGLGFTGTITALVRFDDPHMLRRVLNLEHHIKVATGVNQRDFTGHITLAYLVQPPGETLPAVISLLRPHDQDLGQLTISAVSFANFSDMNAFPPLLTLDLTDGQITSHPDNLQDWLT